MTTRSTDLSTMTEICAVDDIEVEGAVTALVQGCAVAIFRTHAGDVYAISNYDPVSMASVLSRGIVGTRGDAPVVQSPLKKQAFDLRTGQCLDAADVRVPTYAVQIVEGRVWVGSP
jgi:nitrite reductase (NADH) small subunit